MRAIMVCVDYVDILEMTLPYNYRHFEEIMVVTAPGDPTIEAIQGIPNVRPFVTDLFYQDGADFNKFRAMEAGLDAFGRKGMLAILDADILWPKQVDLTQFKPGFLYTPKRRILRDLSYWPTYIRDESQWSKLELMVESEFAGYSQVFSAEDSRLGPAPWHETDWRHAGGADSFFQYKWPDSLKIRPPFQVLHLGEPGKNWCGRTTPYLCGSVPEGAEEKQAKLHDYLNTRPAGPHRFEKEKLQK